MSYQRQHGQVAKIWPQAVHVDRRGNRTVSVDMDANPLIERVAIVPDRASRAEVPGQQSVNVVQMVVDPNLKDVGLWSRVFVQGSWWDVSGPPAYHHGSSRHTRHWTIPLRRRPTPGAGDGEEDLTSG